MLINYFMGLKDFFHDPLYELPGKWKKILILTGLALAAMGCQSDKYTFEKAIDKTHQDYTVAFEEQKRVFGKDAEWEGISTVNQRLINPYKRN